MRRTSLAFLVSALGVQACGLLTSLDGYSDGVAPTGDGGLPDGQASVDADATDGGSVPHDGGSDASTAACDLTKPFQAPVSFGAPINTASNENAGALSQDGLRLYFCSDRASSVPGTSLNLFVAERPTTTAPWATVTVMDTVSGDDRDCDPHISNDELTLFFDSNRFGGPGGRDLFVATRASKAVAFGAPTRLPISTAADDEEPWVSPDGQTLYYKSGNPGALVFAKNSGAGFASATNVPGIAGIGSDEAPVLTPDELTIFFASTRTGTVGGNDIWTAKRGSKTDAFQTPTRVAELSSTSDDYPTWLSADGCQIIVQTMSGGAYDIFLATRPK